VNHKDSLLRIFWDQWSWAVASVVCLVCFVVALCTGPVFGAPYLIVAQFILSDFTVKSFSNDYTVFKKPEFTRTVTLGSLQVFSAAILVLYVLIIKNLDIFTIVLWCGVIFGFGLFGILNLVKAALIRGENQKQAAREAIVEAFKQMAREDEEEKEVKQKQKVLLVEESLLESLAFLTDIEPENK
jgi:hypothetical protein